MKPEERFWQIVLILVQLFSAAAPIYIAYDIYHRGPTTEKRIELREYAPIDLKRDLSVLGDDVGVSLKFKNETLDNLVIIKAWLTNAGTSPILPADFHENLSVSTSKPWHIVAVENANDLPDEIKLAWVKANPDRFEAKPTLLNPGDTVTAVVYLTNTELENKRGSIKPNDVKLKWDTRITNLPKLAKVQTSFTEHFMEGGWGFIVYLSGWSLVSTILGALLFQALYMHLLTRAGYIKSLSSYSILALLFTSLLSFSAAESISYYLFPTFLRYLGGPNYPVNVTIIVGNMLLLMWLYRKARAVAS